MNKTVITCSIVVYKENLIYLHKTIESFLNLEFDKKLYLIDNTTNRFFEYVFVHDDIEYIPIEKNIGFGSAHNKVIEKINNNSDFHLILNPDVFFDQKVIDELIHQLRNNKDLAMIAPKVLFPDGSHQYSCRRYPKMIELIARRIKLLKPFFTRLINKGQYIDKDLETPFNAEYLAGCFHLYKTKDFVKIGGFDERYFLYMEDVDICRKIDRIEKKKLYYPKVEIKHVLKQGSLRKLSLFYNHTFSAIKYYRKWGFK